MFNLEDREKVRELFARFCHSIDEGRYEQWVNTFTPDGVFDSPVAGRHAGRDGLLRFTRNLASSEMGKVKQRHLITNLSMSLEADRGTTVCNLTVWVTRDGATTLLLVGGYNTRLRKMDGEWYFENVTPFVDTKTAVNAAELTR
jgi:3-phenylpropionate/cinnamic acid dioxygenase small subunit